jgi:hypothetical protein
MLQERRLLREHTTGSVQPTNVGTDQRTYAQDQTRTQGRSSQQSEQGRQPAEPITETIERTPQAD